MFPAAAPFSQFLISPLLRALASANGLISDVSLPFLPVPWVVSSSDFVAALLLLFFVRRLRLMLLFISRFPFSLFFSKV